MSSTNNPSDGRFASIGRSLFCWEPSVWSMQPRCWQVCTPRKLRCASIRSRPFMKSSLAALAAALLLFQPLAAQYRTAVPGYHFEFPRDYFNHPDFQTEWWYYTGNLKSASGHRYGFELTFFREAVGRDAAQAAPWDVKDLYLAHLALSDLDGRRFNHTERINR